MSWVGALLLVVGLSRAIPATRALRRAHVAHVPNMFDWAWVAFFWLAWTAIAAYLTVSGFGARWVEIALFALVAVHISLSLTWRSRHSPAHMR